MMLLEFASKMADPASNPKAALLMCQCHIR